MVAAVSFMPPSLLPQVQGMSFIAAVLSLNLDTADAFIAFSNLLNKPCQMAFFRVDHGLVSIPSMCAFTQPGLLIGLFFQRKKEYVFQIHG